MKQQINPNSMQKISKSLNNNDILERYNPEIMVKHKGWVIFLIENIGEDIFFAEEFIFISTNEVNKQSDEQQMDVIAKNYETYNTL